MSQFDKTCLSCGKDFRDHTALKRHMAKKTPCITTAAIHGAKITCPHCYRPFSTETSKYRHIRQHCLAIKRQDTPNIQDLVAKVEELEKKLDASTSIVVTNSGNTVNTVNTVNNVTNVVNINPWGTPLALTDSDVETALARIPGLVGSPALTEIVDVLMALVKKAHSPTESRNIYLNPKRADQALAMTSEGWAALPLSEATAALFDGASARIAEWPAPISADRPPQKMRIRTLRAEVPVHYRQGKEEVVQLGMKPMEAHLLNTRPGGPGPLLANYHDSSLANYHDSSLANYHDSSPKSSAPIDEVTIIPQELTNKEKLIKTIQKIPMRCEPSGALSVAWIVQVSQAAQLTGQEIFQGLSEAAMGGECIAELTAAQIFTSLKCANSMP